MKKGFNSIITILGWALSAFFLLLAVFAIKDSMITAFLMIVCAAFSNPLLIKHADIKRWIPVLAVPILFVVSFAFMPASETQGSINTEAVDEVNVDFLKGAKTAAVGHSEVSQASSAEEAIETSSASVSQIIKASVEEATASVSEIVSVSSVDETLDIKESDDKEEIISSVSETPNLGPSSVEVVEPETPVVPDAPVLNYILNRNTKKFHYPHCSSVDDMKEKNKIYCYDSREDVISWGYVPCKRCNP